MLAGMLLARIWLAGVGLALGRLPAERLLPGTRSGRLPGARVAHALAGLPLLTELSIGVLGLAVLPVAVLLPLVGSPPGALLRSRGLPRAGAASALPAGSGHPALSLCPARPLLRTRGLPRACVPLASAELVAPLPAVGLAAALAIRLRPGGPVRALRRFRRMPYAVPRVRAEGSLGGPVGPLLRPGGLPGAGVRRILHVLPAAVRVGVAVRSGDKRHLPGHRSGRTGRGPSTGWPGRGHGPIWPGHGRLTEGNLTERALPGRPRPLTELPRSRRPADERALPIAGLRLAGRSVSRLLG